MDHTVSNEWFEVWECADCKLRFTQNIPSAEFIGPYYQSDQYISHSDTEKGLINKLYKLARNYTLNWKYKLVTKTTGLNQGKLLDIGAGTGAFLNTMKLSSWDVVGLEPDASARTVAEKNYQLQLQDPSVLYTLPSASFDAITMWHVLEHVHDLHQYMDEIKRLLTSSGTAFIAVPNYTSYDADVYQANWAAYDVPRHLYHFCPEAIRTLAAKHDLTLKEIKPMWLDAVYISMLSEKYKNGKGNLFAALQTGLSSNRKAVKNKERCSSLVYVLSKKQLIS